MEFIGHLFISIYASPIHMTCIQEIANGVPTLFIHVAMSHTEILGIELNWTFVWLDKKRIRAPEKRIAVFTTVQLKYSSGKKILDEIISRIQHNVFNPKSIQETIASFHSLQAANFLYGTVCSEWLCS